MLKKEGPATSSRIMRFQTPPKDIIQLGATGGVEIGALSL